MAASLFLAGTTGCVTGGRPARPPRAEVRAVWLNPWAFNSPEIRAATLAKVRRAHLNTVFLQTPSVAGNYGIEWGGASPENYTAFLKDLKAAGITVHGWIINRERRGQGTQADFTSEIERNAQRDWALAVLAAWPALDGIHFDYIRYGDWASHDTAKAAGVTETVASSAEAIRAKCPGKNLTAAVFTAASPSYMGHAGGGKRAWEDPAP